MATELEEALKWPSSSEDVTVDSLLRGIGFDTQMLYLRKMHAMSSGERPMGDLYMARTLAVIGGVGLMACLRAFREAAPEEALAFARDYWAMCEAGDSFGEQLWEYTEAAGLNPELIRLPTDEVGE